MTMVQRLESITSVDRERRPDEDARETLRAMCHSLGELLQAAQRPAQRIAMTVGPVSLEVEWPAPPAATPADGWYPAPVRPAAVAGSDGNSHNGRKAAGQAVDASTIRAPLVGTFYVGPEPGASPFVKAGDVVEAGQQVGIVEAMKLMNPIEADRRGRVVEILVGDAVAVEYDQPLIVLASADEEAWA